MIVSQEKSLELRYATLNSFYSGHIRLSLLPVEGGCLSVSGLVDG